MSDTPSIDAKECEDCHAKAGTICSDADCPGKRVKPAHLEHVPLSTCWCEPYIDYTDPDTGASVWVHRDLR